MSFTIERHNSVVFFEINNTMVSKVAGKWITLQGEKFNRNIIHNMLHSKTVQKQSDRVQLKSILNRFFNGNYSFK